MRYDSFEVLENIQCSHVFFQGLALNVCTSGSSGVMTLTIQAGASRLISDLDSENM